MASVSVGAVMTVMNRKEFDAARIASGGLRLAADTVDQPAHNVGTLSRDEDAFGVAPGESPAGGRRSGLVENGRALARRLAEKKSGDRIVPTLVADGMHLRRIGVGADARS